MLLLLILSLVAAILYYYIERHYAYWERKNLPHQKPNIPFGSLNEVRKRKRSFGLVIQDIYKSTPEKLYGIYLFFKPTILIRDAELARTIMTSDFASFHDRGIYVDEKHNPFSANLLALEGQSWRTLRAKLTPSFTSGKLKGMYGTIEDVSAKMIQHLHRTLAEDSSQLIELKDLYSTYAIDIIGSVIFGLDVDSFANPGNEFRALSTRFFAEKGFIETIRQLTTILAPSITKFIQRYISDDPINKDIYDIIKRTIDFRESNNVVRRDLLQLLIQLRNTGKISEDDDKMWDVETSVDGLKSMSIEMIAAQALLFYMAGSETTAATASYTIYELAMYPELMKKAQEDIDETLRKHNITADSLTYEAVQDMKFLELCIMETVRKYPGLPVLNRVCTQDYPVPDTKFTIEKGTPIIISLFGLHHDPEYFPEPERYYPERFLEDIHQYNAAAYMPFGVGPRHCIAERMGRMNSKIGVIKFLANFNVAPIERKEVEFVFSASPVLVAKDGLNVRVSKRKAV